ncbi:hypothetical protein [Streptomyces sp. NPDC000880]
MNHGVHLLHGMGDTFEIMHSIEEHRPAQVFIQGRAPSRQPAA